MLVEWILTQNDRNEETKGYGSNKIKCVNKKGWNIERIYLKKLKKFVHGRDERKRESERERYDER